MQDFDDLPTKTKMRPEGDARYRDRYIFPWKKVDNFLKSRLGYSWDDVISEYVHLEWVPRQYRTYSRLCEAVESHTFFDGDKIKYYSNHSLYSQKRGEDINDYYGELFYVHPTFKTLQLKKKAPKTNWDKRRKNEETKTFRVIGPYKQLLKLNGIWYYVWAENISSEASKLLSHDARLIDITKKYWEHSWISLYGYLRPNIRKTQLSHAELVKYGVKNDINLKTVYKKCSVCGGYNCKITHKTNVTDT